MTKEHLVDGPYILYKKDTVECLHVEEHGRIIKKQLQQKEKEHLIINCQSATTKHHFKVGLIPKLNENQCVFKDVKSIFALSDIEGNFYSFTELLLQHQVITKELNWNFKEGHLVIVGDIFDRQEDVLACLWLIYKLEAEAERANGKVHLLVGNHEAMVLSGDLRYVREKYLKLAQKLKLPYEALFSENTELGSWLCTKSTAIIINDDLYVHGGLSTELCKNNLSIDDINQIIRIYLGQKKELFPLDEEHARLLFSSLGPLWYRGYFLKRSFYDIIEEQELKEVLSFYKVNRLIVGHTTFEKVTTIFKNRVIGIDILKPDKPHIKEALYIINNEYYRAKQNGRKKILFKRNE